MARIAPSVHGLVRALAAFAADRRGGVTLMFAAAIFVLFGFGAMAVDVGSFFYEKRRQQTANDLAALAAAGDLPRARAAAEATATRNGFAPGTIETVQHGIYTADAGLPVEQRFVPGPAATANAVRVRMKAVTPMLLGRVLSASSSLTATPPGTPATTIQASYSSGDVPIGSSAIATQEMQAAFTVGSRLAKLEGGVLNGLLGSLLGGSLSLSVMDYEALAKARIDLFDFSKRLATRANLTAVTFDDVLQANVRLPEVLTAIQEASRDHATGSPAATSALSRLATAHAGSTRPVDLRALAAFGTFGEKALSEPAPIAASLTALDMVSAIAQIANGARQIDLSLALQVPGIASVQLRLGIGERPVGTSLVSVGRMGASVHTAQTRLLFTVELVGSGSAALVRLPLYLELAAATAKLSSIQCNGSDAASARVTLAVTPALVDAWIGQVSMAEFANFRSAPNPPAATLLNLAGLASVSGRAHATMTNLAPTPVSFGYSEILRGDKRTTSTQNFTATLLSRLVGDLDIRVQALGLGLGVPGLGPAVSGVIAGAATPLDQVLNAVLGTLGLGLGQADSWVTGVRCGGAVLVR
jgi:uncharacterized membrane protein